MSTLSRSASLVDLWKTTAQRYWFVLRYYRSSQIARRVLARCRHAVSRVLPLEARVRLPDKIELRGGGGVESVLRRKLEIRPRADALRHAEQILAGRFCFLNQEVALGEDVDWYHDDGQVSELWRFRLHYQEYLLDLINAHHAAGNTELLTRAWQLVSSWLDKVHFEDRHDRPDAWHPYCISHRIPNWLTLWTYSPPPTSIRSAVQTGLLAQCMFLERNLELDLRGNHLLENLKALAFAGSFFAGPHANRWLEKCESLLRREIAEQVVESGEHFERSPMYHCHVMELLRDISEVCRDVKPELSRLCRETSERMAAFIQPLLHPDGEFPLFADSCLGETLPTRLLVDSILGAGERTAVEVDEATVSSTRPMVDTRRQATSHQVGGYWVFNHEEDFVVFDAGPVGADCLPAHAHCDLLTLEASLAGQRLIVDSGVYEYEDGEMRRYCRSTAAHNALQIDDADHCDVWSRFRMGYRGWTGEMTRGIRNGFHWAKAGHNAYRRLGTPQVSRWLACRAGGPWICVDTARGKGNRRITQRLHFHPDVAVEQVAADKFSLSLGRIVVELGVFGLEDARVEQGWYCPRFGVRQAAPVVTWSAMRDLSATCGWVLQWGPSQGQATIDGQGDAARLFWTDANEAGPQSDFELPLGCDDRAVNGVNGLGTSGVY